MANTSFTGYFPSPALLSRATSNRGFNSTTTKLANIIQAPKSGDISHIRLGVRNVNTGCTINVRAETVDTSTGDPTGTLINSGAEATLAIADTDDNSWLEAALGTAATVSAGQFLAPLISYASGSTPIINVGFNTALLATGIPYHDTYNGSSWAKTAAPLTIQIKYSGDADYSPVPGLPANRDISNTSFNNTSSPDERGNKFVAPFNMRVVGAGTWVSTTTSFDFVLYDSTDTELAVAAIDGDVKGTNGVQIASFDEAYIDLIKGETYRIAQRPSTSSNVTAVRMQDIKFPVFGMSSDQIQATNRTDAGSWTDDTTEVQAIFLALAGGDFDSSGGGSTSYSFS